MSRDILLGMLLILLATPVHAADAVTPLMICGVEKAPLRYRESGQYKGLDVDIISIILNSMHVDYRFRLEKSAPRHVRNWEDGACDIVLSYSHNNTRKKSLHYPHQSHLSINWNFFIRSTDNERIHYKSLKDLSGLRVGATSAYAYSPEFWQMARKGVFTLDTTTCNGQQLKKLLMRRFDVVPLNTIAALHSAQQDGFLDQITYLPKPLTIKSYFNTFVKKSNHPDLKRVRDNYDEILRELIQNGTWSRLATGYGLKIPPPEITHP